MMKVQDEELLLEPSYKSTPITFNIYAFKGLKLVSCVIGIIILCVLFSKVNLTLIINLKEKQSHMIPTSTVQPVPTRFQMTKPMLNDGTTIKLSGVSIVGNPLTKCLLKSNDVLEIITHSFEGGCAVPFERLKLPIKNSLSNQVLEFDMEFLVKPYDVVGRHGGIYYGNHSLGRNTDGNTVVDWIDRTSDRGYRFYQTGPYPDYSNILLPRKKEPMSHLKIIIKSNGEHIIVAENDIWKNLTGSTVQLLNQPYLGFWAWGDNHLRISNIVIRPYTRCDLGE